MRPNRSLSTSGALGVAVTGTPGIAVTSTPGVVLITSAVVYPRVAPKARRCVGVICATSADVLVTSTVIRPRVDPCIIFVCSTSASVLTSAIPIVYSALSVAVINIAVNTRVLLIGDIRAVRVFIGRSATATVCARGRIISIVVIPSYSTCSPVVAVTISAGIRLVGTIGITTGGRIVRGLIVVLEGVFDFVNDVRHDGQW